MTTVATYKTLLRNKHMQGRVVVKTQCLSSVKVTVDLQRPNFKTFFFFAHNIAKTSRSPSIERSLIKFPKSSPLVNCKFELD